LLASLALPPAAARYAAPALGVFAREKRSGLARLRRSLAPLARIFSFWAFSKVSQIFFLEKNLFFLKLKKFFG